MSSAEPKAPPEDNKDPKWYKRQRATTVKDMFLSGNKTEAISLLQSLIAQHEANFVPDYSYNSSELGHMKHALRHMLHWNDNDPQVIKDKLAFILTLEPEADMPTLPH